MIVEYKIDDRLIHGQMVSYWIPHYKVDRVLIVDNEVANDETRKMALRLGCKSCKLSVFDAKKAAVKLSAGIDKGIRVLVLCNSPAPLLEMMENGMKIASITVGNLTAKEGSKQIKNTVYCNAAEREIFAEIVARGTQIIMQNTPSDPAENITKNFR